MVVNIASGGSCGDMGKERCQETEGGSRAAQGFVKFYRVFLVASYHLVSHCLATLLLFSRHFILFICALRERNTKFYGIS